MSVIATTKLEVPPRRDGLVPRGALVALVAGAEHTRLTMLSAPAGSGKTTLLQQWHLAAAPAQPFAWLSLDPSDNDPVRFWTCVIEALRTVAPGVGARAEGALRSPGVSLEEVVVPLLVNELASSPAAWSSSSTTCTPWPARTSTARSSPSSSACRPRSASPWRRAPTRPGRCCRACAPGTSCVEIRSGQMRFSEDEAGSYLASLGVELAAEQVAEIQQRTEGWAAGLQLAGAVAARASGGRAPRRRASPATTGRSATTWPPRCSTARRPRSAASCVRTSILERMCRGAVRRGHRRQRGTPSASPSSIAATCSSSRSTPPALVPLPPLFADLLRRGWRSAEPGTAAELHGRAAAWLS